VNRVRLTQPRIHNHRVLAENSAFGKNTATLLLAISSHSNASRTARPLHYRKGVTLKIETVTGERGTTLQLIGRIRAGHLAELREQITASAPSALELKEVSLVGCGRGPLPEQLRGRRDSIAELLSLHTRVDRQGTGKLRQRIDHPPAKRLGKLP
jgi:hypothetical protein